MLRVPAIKIEQPLGVFFAVSLKAEFLLDVCYTIRPEFVEDNKDYDHHKPQGMLNTLSALSGGSQRKKDERRIEEITRYTETVEASFPNSIILGANYTEEGRLVSDPDSIDDNDRVRWRIEKNGDFYYLVIPTKQKLASIIDGQHRLYAFKDSKNKQMDLLCSVYIDLPMPYHAQIFATINMNQKKVDRNHIYTLFQFQLEAGDSDTWSPETLAVYFARVLAEEKNSPFYHKMKLGISTENTSSISMASIVDGIMSLITSKPKEDREILYTKTIENGRSRMLLSEQISYAPLRELYILNQDKTLFDVIFNYFKAVEKTLWNIETTNNVFKRTLGIQALFDFLKEITKTNGVASSYTIEYFESFFEPAMSINFTIDFFGIQTKLRSRLKSTLLLKSGLKLENDIKNNYNEEDIKYILTSLE